MLRDCNMEEIKQTLAAIKDEQLSQRTKIDQLCRIIVDIRSLVSNDQFSSPNFNKKEFSARINAEAFATTIMSKATPKLSEDVKNFL